MRRRAMLGLLGTAGVAGCLRLEGGPGTTTEAWDATATETETSTSEPETATTTESDEPTERPEQASYPVGLSDDGVDQFLFDSHTRALTGTSCRTSWRKLNHTEGTVDLERTYAIDSGVALGEWTTSEGGTVAMFRRADEGFWREGFGDEDVYGEDEVGFEWERVSWGVEVAPMLSAWAWGTPERANDARPAEWTVTATDVADASSAPGYHAETVQSLDEATMRVNEDGVILSLSAKYTIDEVGSDGQTLTYESTFRTDAIGEVSASEPSWLSTARDRAPEWTATYVNDRQFVELTLESGGPLVADSRIVLVPEGGPPDRREVELMRPLEPGTTAYVYHDESDPFRQARLSRGSPPSDASPSTLPETLDVYLYRDDRVYSPPLTVP